jgi:hypothetical protein
MEMLAFCVDVKGGHTAVWHVISQRSYYKKAKNTYPTEKIFTGFKEGGSKGKKLLSHNRCTSD